MLEIEGINSGYGNIHVLFDINTKIPDKLITVIVGPNGSGKSTLLKTIMGITQVYSGEVTFNGTGITRMQPHVVTKLGIAYLPQVDNVFAELKVKENLLMACYLLNRGEAEQRVQDVLEDFPILKEYLNKKARQCSGGERQMLAMAMAMIRRPKIMLFDEPTGSLAPIIAFEVLDKIVELREQYGMTIVLAEQNARRALEHGDRALLLVSGRVMYEGGSQELLDHEELGKVYLGIQTN